MRPLPIGKWTETQRERMHRLINTFSANNPMIVSEENWYKLKENGMLDMARTLIKTKEGLIIKVPFGIRKKKVGETSGDV